MEGQKTQITVKRPDDFISPSGLPRFVTREVDRHGNVRIYYRRFGRRKRLREEPMTMEFFIELGRCITHRNRRSPLLSKIRQWAPSYVYFVLHGKTRVKIGVAKNVQNRVNQLQTGIIGKLNIYYATPGSYELERELHRIFAAHRLTGEWFTYCKDIRAWIDADVGRRMGRDDVEFYPNVRTDRPKRRIG